MDRNETTAAERLRIWSYYLEQDLTLPWEAVDAALAVQSESTYGETKDRLTKLQFDGLFKALRTALRRTGGTCSTSPGEGEVWRYLTIKPVYIGTGDEHPELIVALPHWEQPRIVASTDWADRYEYALCGYHPFFRALFATASVVATA